MSLEWNESSENVRSGNFRICDLESDALDQGRALQLGQGVKVGNLLVVDKFILLLGVIQLAVDDVTAESQAVAQQRLADLKWKERIQTKRNFGALRLS